MYMYIIIIIAIIATSYNVINYKNYTLLIIPGFGSKTFIKYPTIWHEKLRNKINEQCNIYCIVKEHANELLQSCLRTK